MCGEKVAFFGLFRGRWFLTFTHLWPPVLHQVALLLEAHGIHGAQGSPVMVGAQWAIAGSGIFRQLVVGQSELPGPLKVVLFPAIMCESTLKALAGGLRATQGGLVA